ncbi:TetR/AcrR family transcriptional regulator [Nocardioides guangzhouensis]|uniref:TetR/AcrR family transcriptional regulator n=1 Tax=Nocardioides guangzhouensis TaxID=2497878 RepID=A0A4Q4ZIF0_9ACTN|nr:TetR family transcriptional regulator [Nocardioides guangzhouensis]RYP87993.1 TetR/AcrR family transcriptional regulator [Nocardioides guangzhouensis]
MSTGATVSARGPGRRPGSPDTRAAILAAARELFAHRGFSGTTVRAIAGQAGVDPALVHHYFGTKNDLFVAALELPVDPRQVLAPILAQGADGAGERLLRAFLSVWEDPDARLALLGVVRGFLEPDGHRLLTEGFLPTVLVPAGVALGIDEPERRMPLVASQIIGLIMTRYVVEVPAIVAMSADDVVATYAPLVQHFLTDPLP